MTEWINSMVLRIFAGGMLCTLILIIVGDGAQREIARIGCAALMIILILTPAQQFDWSGLSLTQNKQALESTVDDALSTAQQLQKNQADAQLQAQIETQAASLGAPCQAQVLSSLTDGLYAVRQVTLRFEESADAAAKTQVIQSAASSCGIGAECVVEEREAES